MQVKENGKQNMECKNRISEIRVPARAWTSLLERTRKACKSTGCMKDTLDRAFWRSSGRPVYNATSLERTPSLQKVLGARNSRSSGRFPTRAVFKLSGNSRTVLGVQIQCSKVSIHDFWLNFIYLCTNMVQASKHIIMELNFKN